MKRNDMLKLAQFPPRPKPVPLPGWRLRIALRRVALFVDTHPTVQALGVMLLVGGLGYALLWLLLASL